MAGGVASGGPCSCATQRVPRAIARRQRRTAVCGRDDGGARGRLVLGSNATASSASGVPLDTEHMEALLEEELLTSLVEELGLRGTVDVDQGTLELRATREGDRKVHFGGYLTLTDMALESGLPVVIQSARAHVYDLIVEDGELRGWGRIENLYGDCFESELGPVSALVSYVVLGAGSVVGAAPGCHVAH